MDGMTSPFWLCRPDSPYYVGHLARKVSDDTTGGLFELPESQSSTSIRSEFYYEGSVSICEGEALSFFVHSSLTSELVKKDCDAISIGLS